MTGLPWLAGALLTLLLSACGSDDNPATPDPLAGIFREGVYTRTADGRQYEVRFGVAAGSYILLVDGTQQRQGTHTLVLTQDGEAGLALIDEGEFAGKCPLDEEPGVYAWRINGDKLELEVIDDNCDQRATDMVSEDWLYQGPVVTPTP